MTIAAKGNGVDVVFAQLTRHNLIDVTKEYQSCVALKAYNKSCSVFVDILELCCLKHVKAYNKSFSVMNYSKTNIVVTFGFKRNLFI